MKKELDLSTSNLLILYLRRPNRLSRHKDRSGNDKENDWCAFTPFIYLQNLLISGLVVPIPASTGKVATLLQGHTLTDNLESPINQVFSLWEETGLTHAIGEPHTERS